MTNVELPIGGSRHSK